jgi:hypothetical protein
MYDKSRAGTRHQKKTTQVLVSLQGLVLVEVRCLLEKLLAVYKIPSFCSNP